MLVLATCFLGSCTTQSQAVVREKRDGQPVQQEISESPTPILETRGAVSEVKAPRSPTDGKVVADETTGSSEHDSAHRGLPVRPKLKLQYRVPGTDQDPSEKIVLVALPPGAEKVLDSFWTFLLTVNKDTDLIVINNKLWHAREDLHHIRINTPFGEREISEYEAEDLVKYLALPSKRHGN